MTGFCYEEEGVIREAKHDRHSVAAHVGIDRATVTAAESVFYTLEALDPHVGQVTREPAVRKWHGHLHPGDTAQSGRSDHVNGTDAALVGWLNAEDDCHQALQALLNEDDHAVYIGHHRTRGYGRVQLSITPLPTVDSTAAHVMWEKWSNELSGFLTRLPFAVASLDPAQDFFFSLSLPTGAILVDDLLRYSLDPATMVRWLPPLPRPDDGLTTPQRPATALPTGGTARCVAAVTKHERLRGWNAAHGLPRQDEWAVMRGSVYAYWFQGTADQLAALKQELWQFSEAGVGLRRNEGFGAVEVSDDFHRRFCKPEGKP
jgi:CRISPR-associated Csx10 family RAMP protein